MRFVQRALNSVNKCELTKYFVFPTWPVTSGFLGTASLQILNWALVLYKGTLHVPALKKFWRPNPESECSVVSLSYGFTGET